MLAVDPERGLEEDGAIKLRLASGRPYGRWLEEWRREASIGQPASPPEEDLAARHLESAGMEVLARNWRCREGELADGCVTCPWHGSTFRLADGAVVHGPSTHPQPSLDTRVSGDRLQVKLRG